jgi:hypothetical protein
MGQKLRVAGQQAARWTRETASGGAGTQGRPGSLAMLGAPRTRDGHLPEPPQQRVPGERSEVQGARGQLGHVAHRSQAEAAGRKDEAKRMAQSSMAYAQGATTHARRRNSKFACASQGCHLSAGSCKQELLWLLLLQLLQKQQPSAVRPHLGCAVR